MTNPTRNNGLRTIFSIFLGLMLTAFVGVGVYTFHAPPDQAEAKVQELMQQEQAVRGGRDGRELTADETAKVRQIEKERVALSQATMAARKPWMQSTSIILMIFATLVMALSLVKGDALPVISNGLLLGGVFTMLYGVGWMLNADSTILRFGVMTAALAITIGLGYLRFVRTGASTPTAAGGGDGLSELERRVRDLEARVNSAAAALDGRS
jgi:hypothetical protein